MNKVRLFIIINSLVLSIWLAASFFSNNEPLSTSVQLPDAPVEVSLHEVE